MKLNSLSLLATAAVIGWLAHAVPVLANATYDPPGSGQSGSGTQNGGQQGDQGTKPKKEKKSEADFLRDYHKAFVLVHDQGDYVAGIAAFRALGQDNHSDVATEIGYAYRKLGDYKASQVWYDRALASNPLNTRTLEYYGLWQLEQGNRLKALDNLQQIRLICGNPTCDDYRDLKSAIDSGKFTY